MVRPVNKDDRFDWRDPDMPTLVEGVDNLTGKRVFLVITAEERQEVSKKQLSVSMSPSWRDDPSYNWRKR